MTWKKPVVKKKIQAFLSLLLTLLLLVGCDFSSFYRGIFQSSTEHELVDYQLLEYSRPDHTLILEKISALKTQLEYDSIADYDTVYDQLAQIVDDFYYEFQTMLSLAFINYTQDITDSESINEYYELLDVCAYLETELESLYVLCASSRFAESLEFDLMGEGFFDDYQGDFSLPDELLSLMNRENALLMQYSEAMSERFVSYDGIDYTAEMISEVDDDVLYDALYQAYFEKYNECLGSIYVELVAVRNQIAAYWGFETYAEFAFAVTYGREYTVKEAESYLNGIREFITPMYRAYLADGSFWEETCLPLTPEELLRDGQTLFSAMSEDMGTLYERMLENHLYTVGSSDTMYYGSYQTYFNAYETPYLFVNGNGDLLDIQTIAHEFGHFASAYYNYGMIGSNDESEVASQGWELLTLGYLDAAFSEAEQEQIRRGAVYSLLASFNESAAWTAFENLVYADNDLTLEECNEYYESCAEAYGLLDLPGGERADAKEWVFISHLIEYPYYLIGYSVSADVAVQLYELEEAEKGRGIDTYLSLIQMANRYDFFGNLDAVDLASPFSAGRAEAVADFFEGEMKKIGVTLSITRAAVEEKNESRMPA